MASERMLDKIYFMNALELERKSNDGQNGVFKSSGKDVGVFKEVNNNIGNRQVKKVAIVMTEDSSIISSSSIPPSIQTINPTSVPLSMQYPREVSEDLDHRKAFQQTATGKDQNVPEQQRTGEDGQEDKSNNSLHEKQAECNDDCIDENYNIFANDDSSSDKEVTAMDEDIIGKEQNIPEQQRTGEDGQEHKINDSLHEKQTECNDDTDSDGRYNIFADDSSSDQEETAMDVDINEISPLPNKRKLKISFHSDSDIENIEDIKIMSNIPPIMMKNRKRYKLSKLPPVQRQQPATDTDWEVPAKQMKAKVRRETQVPHAVKRLQDWNNKGDAELRPLKSRRKEDNSETKTQTEGSGELQDGSGHSEDNPEINTQTEGYGQLPDDSRRREKSPQLNIQTPSLASNSVEDQLSICDQVPRLNDKGLPGTSKTATNIGQRRQVANKSSCRPQVSVNGNPKQTLARPAKNLLNKAVQSRLNTNHFPGQLQDRLARHGITVTPSRSVRNSDSIVAGSAGTAGSLHISQRTEPVNQMGDGSVAGQGNVSENAPESRQPPGTCKSPANHPVQFQHLARPGVTITAVGNSRSVETAGPPHISQGNLPVNMRGNVVIRNQGNLSIKIKGGNMTVRQRGVTVEMNCEELDISGPSDDVLKVVNKYAPNFSALE